MNPRRIKFVPDVDASFEESNGEARPLTEQEYRGNEYRACPKHPRSKTPPARVDNGRAWCGVCGDEYADVPYAEYLAYYGNPERHVYLGLIVEEQCHCCKEWRQVDSLWGIDFMDDAPELSAIAIDQWITAVDARKLPGYAGELAREYEVTL